MSFTKAISSALKVVNKTFGTEVQYTHIEDATVKTIKGVFDNAYTEIQTGSTTILSHQPILRITLSDLDKAPEQGDLALINGKTYTVEENRPDSFGSTTLILTEN